MTRMNWSATNERARIQRQGTAAAIESAAVKPRPGRETAATRAQGPQLAEPIKVDIPNTQTGGTACTWTTTNANDILLGFSGQNPTSADAGWAFLGDTNNTSWFDFGEFQSVAATQAGTTATIIVGSCIADAIQKGP
jgi:hypothetical protein